MSKVAGVFLAVVALVASLLSVSAAEGVPSWSTPITIPSTDSPWAPQMVVDSNGLITTAWLSTSIYGSVIQTSSGSKGLSWSAKSDIGAASGAVDMAIDGSGNAYAVWFNNSTILSYSTKPSGGSWSTPANISNGGRTYTAPQIVANGSGSIAVTWGENDNSYIRTKPAGGSWSGITLLNPSYHAGGQQVAIDDAGNVTAMWTENVSSVGTVLTQYKPASGSWGSPIALTSTTSAEKPQLVSDAAGNITAIWIHNLKIEAVSKPFGGSWSTATTLDSNNGNYSPQLAVDIAGNVVAVWSYSNSWVRVSKLPFGGSWTTEVTAFTGSISNPQVIFDASGNIVATASTGSQLGVSYQLLGSSTWNTTTLDSYGGVNTQTPQLVSDVFGNTTVVWTKGTVINSSTISLPVSRTPTFSTPVKTNDGFTVNVTNYDAGWSWTPSASAGTVTAGTASGSTLPLTVTGLSAGFSSTVTMANTRSGYTNGIATVSSSALAAARTPTFSTPVRTATGFTVNVTNYDASWVWSPSVNSGTVSAGVGSGSTLPLTVSGLSASSSATMTVGTTKSGYVSGSATVSETSLGAAITPVFSSPVATSTGFTVDVTNYDASWTWTPSLSSGSVALSVASGSTLSLTVNGLSAGASSTLTMDTTRSGYANGQATQLGSALSAARTPTFSSPVKTSDGFTVNVTNYDGSWIWTPSVSVGNVVAGTASGSTLPLTVTDMSAGELSTLTVATSRSSYLDGSGAIQTTALNAARTPTFSVPVKTADGFTVNVTNYNASWSWNPSVSAGSVVAGTASGSTLPLTITGLSVGVSSTLTVGTTQSGYVDGTASLLSGALAAARTPTFDTPVRTATGYTVNITNYNAGWIWTPAVSSGSVTVGSASGSTLPLTITGVSPSASSTLTVGAVRSGYVDGTATTSGTALAAAQVPTFDTPVATVDGFTVNVTNYSASWAWAYAVSAGTVTAGTPSGATVPLTVTGLNPGAFSTVTVGAARSAYADGVGTLTFAAQAPANPVASLLLTAAIGQSVAGSNVSVTASGLQLSAPFSVTVHSTPQVLGTGHAVSGVVTTNFTIPADLEPGWHYIVFSSLAYSGATIEEILYFKVSAAGALLATSTSTPADLAVTGNGTFVSGALIALLAFGAGIALVRARRRLARISTTQ